MNKELVFQAVPFHADHASIVRDFQSLSPEEQMSVLVTLIGNRPVLTNFDITGDIEAVRSNNSSSILINNYVHKRGGPTVIQAKSGV